MTYNFLNIISLILAIVSSALTIWTEINPSNSKSGTKNIVSLTDNRTTIVTNVYYGQVRTNTGKKDLTIFVVLMILGGYLIQPYINILLFLPVVTSVAFAMNVKFGTKKIYFPLCRVKYILWSISPVLIVIMGVLCAYIGGIIRETGISANASYKVIMILLGVAAFLADVIFLAQQLFFSIIPFLNNNQVTCNRIAGKMAAFIKIWWLPNVICVVVIVVMICQYQTVIMK